MRIDRRGVLKAGVTGVIGGSLWPLALASAAAEGTHLEPLNERLAVLRGLGGNVVVCRGGDGLLIVDSGADGRTQELATLLGAFARGVGVRTVFNTHWHRDQTGGNETFGSAGATIIAHERTRLWIATDHYIPAEDRYEKARPKAAQPTRTFYTTGTLTSGSEHIDYGYLLEAHTDGDIYVYFRDSNVLAVGHVAAPVRDPELDWFAGGWLGARLDALTLLHSLADDATRIVPAEGPVLTRAQLKAEFDVLQVVYNRTVELLRKGDSPHDMLAAGAMQGLARTWSDPAKFLYDVCKGLWAHHNTLSHDIV
jgi:glyoxylase-like metal-dependent hydrolase (beta-lactamase superfamily II)